MHYRYLAFDDAGPYALLSLRPLSRTRRTEGVQLVLIEATEDWSAALQAHRALEMALAADPQVALELVARTVRSVDRPPTAKQRTIGGTKRRRPTSRT